MNEDTTSSPSAENDESIIDEEAAALTPKISYDDFAKVEITIGKILSAEIVEDADKLLKLMVDVGDSEPRQIVSGIREYFDDPESLVGVSCPFITNLAPRTIRGLESNGMILAASHESTLGLLVPHQDIPSGTKAK